MVVGNYFFRCIFNNGDGGVVQGYPKMVEKDAEIVYKGICKLLKRLRKKLNKTAPIV